MDVEVELDGTRYIYIGGDWYNAETFIKPSHVIIQQLNQRLPVQRSAKDATKISKPAVHDDRTFTHDELFPIIVDIINHTYQLTNPMCGF